jgi:hypothetical protein
VGRSRGPTITKRLKERAREEKRKHKAEKRAQRKTDEDETTEGAEDATAAKDSDVDPDLAGIVPGPQPLPAEFYDEEEVVVEESKDKT